MRLTIFFIAILFPTVVLSQRQMTTTQVMEDYTIVKNILTKGHPSLYEYTSHFEWHDLFANFEKEIVSTIKNSNDFYKSLTELTNHLRDGHFLVIRPQLNVVPKLFPIWLKIIDDRLYTDTSDFGIPVGSEILSIDNVSGKELRKRFLKYVPSDGFITSKKDRQIEREFGILHFYEFGAKPSYQVEYKTPSNQTFTKNVESQSFGSIGKRYSKKHSLFENNFSSKVAPYLHIIDSSDTALLRLNSFGLDQKKFQSELKSAFREIKKRKIENLVIDIRQNKGGYPENANYAFSYIAKESFVQPKSQHVIASQLPHKEYSQEIMKESTYSSFFQKHFQNGSKTENEWSIYAPKTDPSMSPVKKGFQGNVSVLIGGNTFSAAATFALNCKNQGIPLIGEETGGGYYFHTGVYPVIYELPNSGIKIMMSFVKIKKHVKDNTLKKGNGVVPDFKVSQSIQDLMNKKDSQLNYALKLLSEQ